MSFGAAKGQHCAAVSQVGGVGRRVAVFVYNPTFGDGCAARHGDAEFAGGDGAGSHIDEHRAVKVARHSDADWVCAKPRFAPAERHNALGGAAGVGGHNANHIGACRHKRVVGDAADVALAEHGRCGDAVFFCLVDGDVHSAL